LPDRQDNRSFSPENRPSLLETHQNVEVFHVLWSPCRLLHRDERLTISKGFRYPSSTNCFSISLDFFLIIVKRSSKLKERRYSSSNSSSFNSLSSDSLRIDGGLVMLKYYTISSNKTSGCRGAQADMLWSRRENPWATALAMSPSQSPQRTLTS
jgi:hypothetical protein